MTSSSILVLNVGSSSIKFAVYRADNALDCLWRGNLENIGSDKARLVAQGPDGKHITHDENAKDHDAGLTMLMDRIDELTVDTPLQAAGHRVVHGGTRFSSPVRISSQVLQELEALTPLAPLHQTHNVKGIALLNQARPQLPQVACFDTAFHHTMPELAQIFALPRDLMAEGIRRYGFHGLSYEYIADQLPHYLGVHATGNVVVAHLGQGASLCALRERKSVATTMSFSPLDGIPMATRSGSIDPGIVLYLQQTMGMTVQQVGELLNFKSGLLGLSGTSGDMRELLASDADSARQTVDFFVYQVVGAIGSLAAALGGLDALVFTGGIGEHSAVIRERIGFGCQWLGTVLNTAFNESNKTKISAADSRVSAWVIPTNEELMIARHTYRLVCPTQTDNT